MRVKNLFAFLLLMTLAITVASVSAEAMTKKRVDDGDTMISVNLIVTNNQTAKNDKNSVVKVADNAVIHARSVVNKATVANKVDTHAAANENYANNNKSRVTGRAGGLPMKMPITKAASMAKNRARPNLNSCSWRTPTKTPVVEAVVNGLFSL